jgi:hypothetical protein
MVFFFLTVTTAGLRRPEHLIDRGGYNSEGIKGYTPIIKSNRRIRDRAPCTGGILHDCAASTMHRNAVKSSQLDVFWTRVQRQDRPPLLPGHSALRAKLDLLDMSLLPPGGGGNISPWPSVAFTKCRMDEPASKATRLRFSV